MYSLPIRNFAIATSLGIAAYLLSQHAVFAGASFLGAAAFLVYGHFRYGTVWLAFRKMKAGDLESAARLLSHVRRPSLLASHQRAHFELASAVIESDAERYAGAERHFRSALEFDLRTDNNRSLAELGLAELLIKRGALAEADLHLDRAESHACNAQVTEQIQELRVSATGAG